MKRFIHLSQPCMACVIAVFVTLFSTDAHAQRLLYASFESPEPSSGTDPTDWPQTQGHPGYLRVTSENESKSTWTTPYGEQGMTTYSNGISEKTFTYLPKESGVFVAKFHISSNSSMAEYRAELRVIPWDVAYTTRTPVVLAYAEGDSDGSKDMSFSDQITWRYDYDPTTYAGQIIDEAEMQIVLRQDPNRGNWRNTPVWDNVSVDFIPDVDTSPPTVTDMVDDKNGGTVAPNSPVTYTVTFNEAMNASTVDVSDFGNAASSNVTIDSVTPTSDETIFTVVVTPTDAGDLRLQINQDAILNDALDNSMITGSAIQDNVTITVDATNPILLPSDIVDDKGGNTFTPNTLVTYTLTFSKDMDAGTITAADFDNAGSASFTIGTISETSPTSGVFTVEVTPTGPGTLRLMVLEGVLLKAAEGESLDTTPAIVEDTEIIVDSGPPTLASADITDDTEGSSVTVGTLVTYDLFFSEDMDASTIDASDFGNAITTGNATFTINSVEEASPGVIRIELTTTGAGTIQLQVIADAVLEDEVGNALVTTSAILDDTTITVTVPASNPYDT